MHCRNFQSTPINRRELLKASGFGFGAFALDAMSGLAQGEEQKRGPHHEAKAKNVIFLYMDEVFHMIPSIQPRLRNIMARILLISLRLPLPSSIITGRFLPVLGNLSLMVRVALLLVISFPISLNMMIWRSSDQ